MSHFCTVTPVSMTMSCVPWSMYLMLFGRDMNVRKADDVLKSWGLTYFSTVWHTSTTSFGKSMVTMKRGGSESGFHMALTAMLDVVRRSEISRSATSMSSGMAQERRFVSSGCLSLNSIIHVIEPVSVWEPACLSSRAYEFGPWREKLSAGCESVIGSLSKLMSLRDFAGGVEPAMRAFNGYSRHTNERGHVFSASTNMRTGICECIMLMLSGIMIAH